MSDGGGEGAVLAMNELKEGKETAVKTDELHENTVKYREAGGRRKEGGKKGKREGRVDELTARGRWVGGWRGEEEEKEEEKGGEGAH